MDDYINRDELLKIRPFTCYMGLSVSEYDEGFLDCAEAAREAIKNLPEKDILDIDKALEWLTGYIIKDDKEVYTNGTDLVPLFRVKQALKEKAYNELCER